MDEIKWEPCTTAAHIGVSATNGVVTLTGSVATYAEKWAVERATRRVGGVTGIADDISVTLDTSHIRTDAQIAEAALASLKWHVWVPNEIQVVVTNGWVTLMGHVNWEYQRTAATDSVCFLLGVKGVSNQIEVTPSAQPAAVKDAIKRALVRNADIDACNVNVSVEGAAITLSGTVESLNERNQAATAAWNAPGVNNVRNNIEVVCD